MQTTIRRSGPSARLLWRAAPQSILAAAMTLLLPPLRAQTPHELVKRAASAMGGEARLRAIPGSIVDFSSVSFGHGQQQGSHAPPRALFATGRISSDHARARYRVDQTIRVAANFSFSVRIVADGESGLSEQNGRLAPAARVQHENLIRGQRLHPVRLVLAALDAPGALQALPDRELDGLPVRAVRFAHRDTVTVLFDPGSGLPVATETIADDAILGDRATLTVYSSWQPASGVLWPRQQDVRWNGVPAQHVTVLAVSADAAPADSVFAIPDSIRSRGVTAAPASRVHLVELARGVWRAEGASHHSLVVEQADQLVVVEAPMDAERTRALLDTLRRRFPGKRVGTVVGSHHHWDHAGGLRAAMAAGIPVAIHARHEAFARRIAAAPKTVVPDALSSRRSRTPVIRPVRDAMTIGRGEDRVELLELPNSHAEGMLVAYVPAARLLFVVDAINTDATPGPRSAAAELVAFVRARGIAVDRVVGGHGGIVEYAAVERAAAP